jgi:hypothetical protein
MSFQNRYGALDSSLLESTLAEDEELSSKSPNTVLDDDKPKKKRRRGKKGGKKVNKKSEQPDEDEATSTTEAGSPEVTESETTHVALEVPSSSAMTDVSGYDETSMSAGKIEEPSPSVSPTEIQGTIDDEFSSALEVTDGNEPTHGSTTALMKKKSRKRGNKGGKQVQKKRTARQDRAAKWEYWRVAMVGMIIRILLHGLVHLIKSMAA